MDTKRQGFIHFRANDKEIYALNVIANQEGVNLSEAVRMILHDAYQRRGLLATDQFVTAPTREQELRLT
ncbi:MAG: hypothetical protein ABSA23_00345 [Anaerolineales bacterium]|jgi:hypothetical protein